jgi:hypothetical protein
VAAAIRIIDIFPSNAKVLAILTIQGACKEYIITRGCPIFPQAIYLYPNPL